MQAIKHILRFEITTGTLCMYVHGRVQRGEADQWGDSSHSRQTHLQPIGSHLTQSASQSRHCNSRNFVSKCNRDTNSHITHNNDRVLPSKNVYCVHIFVKDLL